MSYDLTVFASDLPDLAAALEPETLSVKVDGDVPPIRGSVALLRSKRGRSQHLGRVSRRRAARARTVGLTRRSLAGTVVGQGDCFGGRAEKSGAAR